MEHCAATSRVYSGAAGDWNAVAELGAVASAAFQPGLAKLGNVSAVVLIALLVVLYFNDLIGVVGSGALAVAAVFIAALGAAG